MGRLLVIFDLNGVLVDRVYQKGRLEDADARVGRFWLYVRPGFRELRDWLQRAEVDVAIWSSMTEPNVRAIAEYLFADAVPLRFLWNQSHCDAEPDPNAQPKPDGYVKPLFVKDLRHVWDAFPQYHADNTLLIDDTPEKSKRNPAHCHLVAAPTWTRADRDSSCNFIVEAIRARLQ